jgi:uncharacterized protein YciI
MISLCRLALLSFMLLAPLLSAEEKPAASTEMKQPSPKQFIYVLRLVPRLHDDNAWTEADQAVIKAHVAHLKTATDRGKLMLAGRTLEPGDKTFGLVVFTASDEADARAFMNADPAVTGGIMTAELHLYHVAFRGW